MTFFGGWRSLVLLVALAAALFLADRAAAVQINSAAQEVQLKEGCASESAEACGLRVYQVMVESFVDGDPARNYNAGYGTSHHKGDIRGIINSLDYIKSTGMNAVWLTPVFDSAAGTAAQGGGVNLKLDATGYYPRNYFQIDPKFGSFADAQELVNTAHAKGMYVFFDGVFGHHKGNLVTSPGGRLPVNSSPGVVDYSSQASVEFYKEVATYWVNQLGIDGWRLDQAYQVPPAAWQQIRGAVESASAARATAGHEWGTLGYMVAEVWSGSDYIAETAYGTDANPVLESAFDFPVRYATVGVIAGEEGSLTGRPASVLAENWSYGAHGTAYPDHALPNLMLGNHDLVRFGDLLQRHDIANPADAEYWARHRLAFMVQGAYTGPITRYYGEEIGDEVPGYADRVTTNCANLGLCDDHVARTSAKILGVTVTSPQLSADQHALLEFHEELMQVRSDYAALSHGTRQHLFSNSDLYVDLKTFGDQQIVFAMNVSDAAQQVQIRDDLFDAAPASAWDILGGAAVTFSGGYLNFTLGPLEGRYILLDDAPLLAGDYNDDGVVDAADYTLWRDGGPLSNEAASFGVVDEADFALWKERFGNSLGGAAGAAALPEAGTLAMLMFVATVLAHLRCVMRRS